MKGIYISQPRAEMIARGEMTGLVKSRPLDSVALKQLIMHSGNNIYGTIRLSRPVKISIDEFNQLYSKHKISHAEMVRLWPGRKELFYHDIEIVRMLPEPIKSNKKKKTIQDFRYYHRCHHCGYVWKKKVLNPYKCPGCGKKLSRLRLMNN